MEEVVLVARGIATAVAPEDGLADSQAALLEAIASALTGHEVDYRDLEPLGPGELAAALEGEDEGFRQRIVHHMVLGEIVLPKLPTEVAHRVAVYAKALGIDDKFVRIARRYAQGAFGLAWIDLRRNGFAEHLSAANTDNTDNLDTAASDPFDADERDPELEARWAAYQDLPEGTLGRSVWEMYDGRGFPLPGSRHGAPAYLAQHDYVHVLADYGTNLKGELEVFGLIGRADPDPKGFAWLATLVGLFQTGYIEGTGFFDRDVTERNVEAPGMHHRLADAIRRGKAVASDYGCDLFDVDYEALADQRVEEVRLQLKMPDKSAAARESGSAGLFDREGMSELQRLIADGRGREDREQP